MSWYWKVIPTKILPVGYLVVGKQYIPITVTYIIWQFYSFQALRHEEFKEGCDAACNGLVPLIYIKEPAKIQPT